MKEIQHCISIRSSNSFCSYHHCQNSACQWDCKACTIQDQCPTQREGFGYRQVTVFRKEHCDVEQQWLSLISRKCNKEKTTTGAARYGDTRAGILLTFRLGAGCVIMLPSGKLLNGTALMSEEGSMWWAGWRWKPIEGVPTLSWKRLPEDCSSEESLRLSSWGVLKTSSLSESVVHGRFCSSLVRSISAKPRGPETSHAANIAWEIRGEPKDWIFSSQYIIMNSKNESNIC